MECKYSNVRSHHSNKTSVVCDKLNKKGTKISNKCEGADISPYSTAAIRIADTTSFGK
jgi:hypothetical protein